jgi:hypothetical protein
MTIDIKRRFDIYLNGSQGLKELTVDLLLSWRQVPRLARPVWRSIVDLFWDLLPLLLAMLGPVLVPLAPVLCIWTAHYELTDEEVRQRMRARIHKNGGEA